MVVEPSNTVDYYSEGSKTHKEKIYTLTRELEYIKEINSLLRDKRERAT